MSPERTAEINSKIRGLDRFKELEGINRKTNLKSALEDVSKGLKKDKINLGIDLARDHKLTGKDGGIVNWDQGKMNVYRNNQVFKDGKWVDIPKKHPKSPTPPPTPKPQPTTPAPTPIPEVKPQSPIPPTPKPQPQSPTPPSISPTKRSIASINTGVPEIPKPKPNILGKGGKIALGATVGAGLLAGGTYLLSRNKKD